MTKNKKSMNASIYCTTQSLEQTEAIVADLCRAGFDTRHDISALLPDRHGTRDFAYQHNTKAPEGSVVGGAAGLGIGALLGWLAGVGALTVPGVGALITAGPVMAALSGAAVGGAAGGIIGALIGKRMPEFEAKRFDGKLGQSDILLSVHVDNPNQRHAAIDIFAQHDARHITVGAEAHVSS